MADGGHGEAGIITGILSVISALGVAWFGVIKERGNKTDPVSARTIASYKELTDLQEVHIEALKDQLTERDREIQAMREEIFVLRCENQLPCRIVPLTSRGKAAPGEEA